jgi:hypothetical protein
MDLLEPADADVGVALGRREGGMAEQGSLHESGFYVR